MIQSVKVTAIAVLLVIGAAHVRADQTNLVQNLSVRLSGITPGQTDTSGNITRTSLAFARVGTGTVIQALAAATGNSFSDKARLVVITPLPDGNSTIAVRDGTTSVEVTSYFIYEQKSGFVSTSQTNLKTGRGSSTDYSIQRLVLKDLDPSSPPVLSLHFDVQGIGVQSTTTSPNAWPRTGLDAGVSGSGDQNGKLLILEGSFQVDGNLLEVVDNAPPPNV